MEKTPDSKINPRYLAYCRYHRKSPEEMKAIDRARFVGGSMVGFMLWMDLRWREFDKCMGNGPVGTNAHDAYIHIKYEAEFDKWLQDVADIGKAESFNNFIQDRAGVGCEYTLRAFSYQLDETEEEKIVLSIGLPKMTEEVHFGMTKKDAAELLRILSDPDGSVPHKEIKMRSF
jgi:hypothetical protein